VARASIPIFELRWSCVFILLPVGSPILMILSCGVSQNALQEASNSSSSLIIDLLIYYEQMSGKFRK
jgi:hypothetical protein